VSNSLQLCKFKSNIPTDKAEIFYLLISSLPFGTRSPILTQSVLNLPFCKMSEEHIANESEEPEMTGLKRQGSASLGIKRQGSASSGFSIRGDTIVFDPNRQKLIKDRKSDVERKFCERTESWKLTFAN
jgi:hypothetical protein